MNTNNTEEVYYTVNYCASEGGTIVGITEQTIKSGNSTQSVEAVANDDYKFEKWSDGNTSPVRIEINVTSDISVTALFEKCAERYSVVYESNEGGVILGCDKQLVESGDDATAVIAVANNGYEFVGWSDGIGTERREDKNIGADISVKALFRKKSYIINYSAEKGGSIEGETSQTIEHGEAAATVTAIPDLGYKFVRWSDTGSVDPVRTDKTVTSEINAQAVFAYLRPDGKGVAEDPILINNYSELKDMRLYSRMSYKLNADIDLCGVEFEPLFTLDYPFCGVLDGAEHTIKNMTISGDSNAPSFLGYVNNGAVKNIDFVDFRIVIDDAKAIESKLVVGAIAGEFYGEMKNVSVSGNIDINSEDNGYVAVGGLVGYCEGLIENCCAEISVDAVKFTTVYESNGSALNIGGILGVARNVDVLSCESRGVISVDEHSRCLNVGGMVGAVFLDEGERAIFDSSTTDFRIECNIANVGGFMGRVQNAGGEFDVSHCSISADIDCVGFLGGFASYLYCLNDGKCVFDSCNVDGRIKGNVTAGFIYSINNSGRVRIENSNTSGEIIGAMCAGFCYTAIDNVEFFRCYSLTEINGKAMTVGFVFQLHGGSVKECFSDGTITATFQACGFIFSANYGAVIENSYSYSDIIITNTDETADTRTFACGFIVSAGFNDSIFISDCCYLGNISGHVYTSSSASGMGSIVAAFIGNIYNETTVENCHCYFREDSFLKIIGTNRTPNVIYIYEYSELTDIEIITEYLNRNGDNDVWEVGENGFPKLKFTLA